MGDDIYKEGDVVTAYTGVTGTIIMIKDGYAVILDKHGYIHKFKLNQVYDPQYN